MMKPPTQEETIARCIVCDNYRPTAIFLLYDTDSLL